MDEHVIRNPRDHLLWTRTNDNEATGFPELKIEGEEFGKADKLHIVVLDQSLDSQHIRSGGLARNGRISAN